MSTPVKIKNGDKSALVDLSFINSFIFYFKSQILFFDTFSSADTFVKSLGLKIGVHYNIFSGDNYLKLGSSGNVGGSNNIKFSDIPSFKVSVYNDYGSPLQMTEAGTGTPVASLLPYSGNGKNNRNVFIQNVNNKQTEFLPNYKEIFGIIFLKNISIGDILNGLL